MAASVLNLGSINRGSSVDLSFVFRDATGNPADPTGGLTFHMTPPGGTKTDYTSSLTHVSAGVWTYHFVGTIAGDWTGTAYTTASGEEQAQPFSITVATDANYS